MITPMNDIPERWTQATTRPDLWLDPDDDPRAHDSSGSDERSVLQEYLNHFRLTLQLKCADLTAEQLARRSVPPSTMSLLGLVRHLADVERTWFRQVMAGQDEPRRFSTPDRRDDDFVGAVGDDAQVAEAWAAWREEVEFAENYVANAPDLQLRGTMRDGNTLPLREVLVHLIEEYARHCGHADLLRECIDGRVGQ